MIHLRAHPLGIAAFPYLKAPDNFARCFYARRKPVSNAIRNAGQWKMGRSDPALEIHVNVQNNTDTG
jgi:hypothetical protein